MFVEPIIGIFVGWRVRQEAAGAVQLVAQPRGHSTNPNETMNRKSNWRQLETAMFEAGNVVVVCVCVLS